jgi:hypothetical protein
MPIDERLERPAKDIGEVLRALANAQQALRFGQVRSAAKHLDTAEACLREIAGAEGRP